MEIGENIARAAVMQRRLFSRTCKFELGVVHLTILLSVVSAQSVPSTHDRLGYQYLSPLPGASLVSRQTRIILRPGKALDQKSSVDARWIKVTGSKSGDHPGRLYLDSDRTTVVFCPQSPFAPGDTVTVTVSKGWKTSTGALVPPIQYTFYVSPKTKPIMKPEEVWYTNYYVSKDMYTKEKISDKTRSGKVSLPTDFVPINITRNNPSPGYLFFAPFVYPDRGTSMSYMVILDDNGKVAYYQRDFDPYGNLEILWNGNLAYYWTATKLYYIMDAAYSVVDSFSMVGYEADGHEFRYLNNGHVLMLSYDRERFDLSQSMPGGKVNTVVEGFVIQELDLNRQVVFEWRSWDYLPIADATDSVHIADSWLDYAHCNSIDVDTDGNLLISCRNLDECTKISRITGEIIWRLGGKLCRNNQFRFVNDPLEGFTFQHDFRRLGDNYLVFDNGNNHVPPIPRAVEYQIDERAKTATLVWECRYESRVKDSHQGSIQRLPNGNSLINWGGSFWEDNEVRITEVTPAGDVEFQMDFGKNRYKTYRAFRSDWQGQAKVPYLVVEQNPDAKMAILTYNVFGSQDFPAYNIYHGYSADSTSLLGTTVHNQVELTNLAYGNHHFRVTALDADLRETGFSNDVKVRVPWSDVAALELPMPVEYSLSQNYPNPAHSATTIWYSLPIETYVMIAVYLRGRGLLKVLKNGLQPGGYYSLVWDASEVPSGDYVCRMESGKYVNSITIKVEH